MENYKEKELLENSNNQEDLVLRVKNLEELVAKQAEEMKELKKILAGVKKRTAWR